MLGVQANQEAGVDGDPFAARYPLFSCFPNTSAGMLSIVCVAGHAFSFK
jgi:hypothetical protein